MKPHRSCLRYPSTSLRVLFVASLLSCSFLVSAATADTSSSVPTTWRLLDYIAVDYRGAVNDGKVVNTGEYDEMVTCRKLVRQTWTGEGRVLVLNLVI